MKKIYTTAEFKLLNKRRISAANSKKRKRKRKGYGVPINGPSHSEVHSRYNRNKYVPPYVPPTISIKAPDDFSLLNNTEETITFFNNAFDTIKRYGRVKLDI